MGNYQFVLDIVEPGRPIRQIRLDNHELIAGHDTQCDIFLIDDSVGARQCSLQMGGGAMVYVKNLNTTHPTIVNGVAIDEIYIQPGDCLSIGSTQLILRRAEDPMTTHGEEKPNTEAGPTSPTVHAAPFGNDSLLNYLEALGRDTHTSLALLIASIQEIMKADALLILAPHALSAQGELVWKRLNDDQNSSFISSDFAYTQRGENEQTSPIEKLIDKTLESGETVSISSLPGPRKLGLWIHPFLAEGNCTGLLFAEFAANTVRNTNDSALEPYFTLLRRELSMFALRQERNYEVGLRTRMQRYLSPQIIDQLATGGSKGALGGRALEVAVLFTDIRGFTAFSARKSPSDVVTQLNEYFSVMSQAIFSHGGYLDKFIGDAMMVVFGVPEPKPDDCIRACQSALEMQKRLERLNREWQSRGLSQLTMGIGINYGRVIAGNIGSSARMEFTVIGDVVNVASRLCGVAEPHQVIMSEALCEQARRGGANLATAPITLPPLKGKEGEAIQAFALSSISTNADRTSDKVEGWSR